MHQKPWKYAHSSSLDAKKLKVLMETHWKQKNWRKTQRCLNWMSWNESGGVGWSDATFSSCIRWVLWLEYSNVTVGWTDGLSIGSSDALRFGNSKDWSSYASAPDDLTVWSAVHSTLAFKSYRDAPRFPLQHRMNRRFRNYSAVHPTLVFELHSTAPSGCSLAPDRPMVRRMFASVYCLRGSTAILKL
jgi:hypothetical protein